MLPLLLTLIFVFVGVLLMALAVPLMRRRVPPNPLYGLRVRATFADSFVWYEANAANGRDLFLLGAALALAAAVLPWTLGEWAVVPLVGGLVIGTVVTAVRGTRHANRLLSSRHAGVEFVR